MRGGKVKKNLILLITGVTMLVILGSVVISAYANGQKLNDEATMGFVSHTEYWSSDGPGSDEIASTIVRVTDFKGDALGVSGCTANILYPDKSYYVQNGAMQESSIAGNWFRTDPVPTTEGSYEQEVTCTYGGGKTIKSSQSFHVNPALNFIKNVNTNVLAADMYLEEVNMSLTATVENAKADLSSQLTSTDTDLTNLLNGINASVSSQITSAQANLDTSLTGVKVELQGNLADTNALIVSKVDFAETNLTSLINQVNSQLQAQLDANNASTGSQLSNVEVSVTGTINDAKTEILSAISSTQTDLTTTLDDMRSDLSSQLASVGANQESTLTNVNLTITTRISEAQNAIQTQLTDTETNLQGVINTAQTTIISYLQNYLPAINETVTNVYSDTQWLVSNAMNQDDNAAIVARFNNVDANIDAVQQFCGTALTENSDLCTQVRQLQTTLDTVRNEQTAYFNTVDTTTTNTWNLLSGSIAANIDTALSQLGIIRSQTEDINATVHAIRDDQLDRVYIQHIA